MDVDGIDLLVSLGIGLGLAAACGLRIFLPFLVLGLAARAEIVPLAHGFAWIASTPALVAFGVATALEIAGYYVPLVDNLLDVAATPAAVVAGAVASASVLTDLPPLVQGAVALVGGGAAAGIVKGSTSLLRVKSSVTTAGVANPLLSTVEGIAAAVTSVLAILVPLLALAGVAALLFSVFRIARRMLARGAAGA